MGWAAPVIAVLALGPPAAASRLDGSATVSAPSAGATALGVNPFPGTPDASPSSQIIFPRLPPSAVQTVTVSGSRSGRHRGHLEALPGRAGTAFVPTDRFSPGERVTVRARVSASPGAALPSNPGSGRVAFWFRVAAPVPEPPPLATTSRSRAAQGEWQTYRSEPTLHPPLVQLTRDTDLSDGDIFLSPVKVRQMGPLILGPLGQLVWFHHTGRPTPFNFQVQHYRGHPVLTWWQGDVVDGHGANGQDMILDSSYRTVATLHGGNGYSSDLHEFQLIPHGRALIDAYTTVHADLSSVGGPTDGTVLDCIIQELDIKTNRVLWEWHSLGHVPLSASYAAPVGSGPFDYFHLNSIQQLPDGRLIISARNTWAVYMIDEHTGRVVWTLGGKDSSYHMDPGTNFEWQHDARMHRGGILSVFDDGGFPQEEPESSAKELFVNAKTGVVSAVRRFTHTPPLQSGSQGNTQVLSNGNVVVGWGSASTFSEFTPDGHDVLDGQFRLGVSSYRTYRFPWTAQPLTPPSLAVVPQSDGSTRLYASWNGATQVAAWQVVGGAKRSDLTPLAEQASHGFETAIRLPDNLRYLAVYALGADGSVLHQSPIRATRPHVDIFGQRVFASTSSGLAGVPLGCFRPNGCHLTVMLISHGTLLGTTSASISSGGTRLVGVPLSRSALHALNQASGEQLEVHVSTHQPSGPAVTRQLTLTGYSTAGAAPSQSVAQSPTARFLGTTDFVSPGGAGGILALCSGPRPCQINPTISAHNTVIAQTAVQELGANEVTRLGFQLTPTGQAMLQQAPGNQLGAQVTLSSGNSVARGQVVLSRYG